MTADTTLSDDDVLAAMAEIPGYLDIGTEDFRAVYALAHKHSRERVFHRIHAESLMQTGIEPLNAEQSLADAAAHMARQGLKALPVVDADQRPIGILTESDFLRRLGVDTFLALLIRLLDDPGALQHRCHDTPVSEGMTRDPVCVHHQADGEALLRALARCPGRCLPVIDDDGRLCGLLWRKDAIAELGEPLT